MSPLSVEFLMKMQFNHIHVVVLSCLLIGSDITIEGNKTILVYNIELNNVVQ